ncbi:bifunctional GNAT family N-acetyltransferase/carbon-nitrogen hydrolase family protein [Oleiagrimonas sp.]|uniref:bifunctional GNAT family N-acetyltransferase/carbon-nitrogen hydrolase family protein n=1 Tax=Oleiagrimonas sp. TaxID=2010330 RepID=UPI00260D7B62|nr:bifunctional GNAT family N-acetyltransferase/carbon-nitrogen hydrolase family protein [Oleiagrimonas sp.]MDA3915197.1 bifunctional GNAT family N-acetyltransferase/carbon-nitrogen hydrolase family protein [Oleiagrimonas sp.]
MTKTNSRTKHHLMVRQAQLSDVSQLVELTALIYTPDWGHSPEMLRGQQAHFPEGQFVAEYDGRIVGYCSTFRIDEASAMAPHTWTEITGGGFGSRHDPEGDWLYGMEVVVHPDMRGMRIGQRLYTARKNLCKELKLRGIVFGGRMPGLAKAIKRYSSAENYVQAVTEGRRRDQTLSFQLRNGFEVIGLLHDYVPTDHESLGYATHMVWRNPELHDHPDMPHASGGLPMPSTVRVASVQYQQRRITSFEEFAQQVEYFTDIAADYHADFVTFPELITLQLLSIENEELSPNDTIRRLSEWTPQVRDLFARLAVRYNINIIGGSHPTRQDDGDIHNVCYICLRDGTMHEQEKLHPTPSERNVWGITGGDTASMIQTDCGPIGVMICYDSEFPEVARHLIDQGALMLFVPFCTDVREGYLRVRYSCQARAIENQCYVVMSGNVGNLPGVYNFDIQYGQSCILTPCDFPFARDGVAADSTPNIETVLFADLSLDNIARARNSGTVTNLKDRRYDLYETRWRRRGKPQSQAPDGTH